MSYLKPLAAVLLFFQAQSSADELPAISEQPTQQIETATTPPLENEKPKEIFLPGLGKTPEAIKETSPGKEAKVIKEAHSAQTDCAPGLDENSLIGCTKPMADIAKAYENAFKNFSAWLPEAAALLAVIDQRETTLKTKIHSNEAELTNLRIRNSREDRNKIKELSRENKSVWKSLRAIDQERKDLCRSLADTAAVKVKELNAGIDAALKDVKNRMR